MGIANHIIDACKTLYEVKYAFNLRQAGYDDGYNDVPSRQSLHGFAARLVEHGLRREDAETGAQHLMEEYERGYREGTAARR